MAIVLTSTARAEPFATYADLASLVAKWTHRSDLGDMLPGFLRLAEARIAKDLRLACQLTTATLTQAAGMRGVALPDDWLELKSLSMASTPGRPLECVTPEQLERHAAGPVPHSYAIDGFVLLTGPAPAAAYSLNARYFARLPSLLLSDNNWLTLNHPGIYLWSVLIEAMLFTQNTEQMAAYTQRYLAEVAQLQASERQSTHSGSALRIRTR